MKIGIIGGGQLGRMLIQEALCFQDELYVLDANPEAPCRFLSNFSIGSITDYDTVYNFGKDKDIITIEIENINIEALYALEKIGKRVIPSAASIDLLKDKRKQKAFYRKHGIPTADFQIIQSQKEYLDNPIIHPPFIQKAAIGGYDGRGILKINTPEALTHIWDTPSVIEKAISLQRELAVIIAINEDGMCTFPVVTMYVNPQTNMLDYLTQPALLTEAQQAQINTITKKFAENIQSKGLFAIELFEDLDNKIWVNETAPRLHNSGHGTQNGNITSQFAQLYRILRGDPLGDTAAIGYTAMINLSGANGHNGNVKFEGLNRFLKMSGVYVHLYGKTKTAPARKMGHININATEYEKLLETVHTIKNNIQVISEK